MMSSNSCREWERLEEHLENSHVFLYISKKKKPRGLTRLITRVALQDTARGFSASQWASRYTGIESPGSPSHGRLALASLTLMALNKRLVSIFCHRYIVQT